jgi:hypothetical protein
MVDVIIQQEDDVASALLVNSHGSQVKGLWTILCG